MLVLCLLCYDVYIYILSFWQNYNMILYTIKLSQTEVEDLKKILNKGSHTTQSFRSTYILLNCD